MTDNRSWWLHLIEAIVALVLGLYILISPIGASTNLGLALALFLTVAGLVQTISGLWHSGRSGTKTDMVRGLIGLIGGGVLLLLYFMGWIGLTSGYTILAIVLILFGAVGLYEQFFDRGSKRLSWMAVIVNGLLLLLGVLVFVFRTQEADMAQWAGIILVVIGLGMGAYALFVERNAESEPEPEKVTVQPEKPLIEPEEPPPSTEV
ncbi:MAG: DUF308 domain-containing protein [Chloroflexota bacterium]|nr:DUF308 domain-containing protein [Chloroflexota bacterium]